MGIQFKGKIEDMLLTDNPFRVVPQTNPEIWAGRAQVKKDLEKMIGNGLILSPTQLILVWGDWGTGKTHAARYFNNYINSKTEALSIHMRCPRPMKGVTPFLQQFRTFLKEIGPTELEKSIKFVWEKISSQKKDYLESIEGGPELRAELGGKTEGDYIQDETSKEIESLVGESDLASVLCAIKDTDTRMAAWKWLRGLEKQADLDVLNVASKINNDPSALSAFGAILRLLTFRTTDEELRPAVFIWLDEMDTMMELFGASDQVAYLTGLRDLIDEAPNDVTIFLLFTVRDAEEAVANLGEAVAARLTSDPYNIPPIIEEADAQDFIIALYNDQIFRPDEMKKKCPDKFFPFSEAAVKYIIDQTDNKTPRRLMVNFGKVLENALYEGTIKSPEDRISVDYAVKVITGAI